MSDTYAKALTSELLAHGVEEWYIDETGKHNKLRFRWRDRLLMHAYPKTPGDSQRGLLNCLSDLRRQLGVRKQIQKSENRTKKNRTRPVAPVAEKLTITVKPDPFAVLADHNKQPEPRLCPRMTLAEIAAMLSCA